MNEDKAFQGVTSYMVVRTKDGVKLVERDTFYDMAGEALDKKNRPNKQLPWYWQTSTQSTAGQQTVEERLIDAEPTREEIRSITPLAVRALNAVIDAVRGSYAKPEYAQVAESYK